MNLKMDQRIGEKYSSPAQKIRVITENWVRGNLYCPHCGAPHICDFECNRPVADFYCPHCHEEYELKSKSGPISNKINDGAYMTMIERIKAVHNPNFFFMQYDKSDFTVKNFILVPKYFFSPSMIEKRKPLSQGARRAGWVGCNIKFDQIPHEGRIFIVVNGAEQKPEAVMAKVDKTHFISKYELDGRGWLLDVLNCINKIEQSEFTLAQVYGFEKELAAKHPENHHVKDKIRQQLQLLRDKGIIDFVGRGHYRKI